MNARSFVISTLSLAAVAISGTAFADTGYYVFGGLNSTTLEHHSTRNTGTNEPTSGPAGGPSISVTDKDTGASVFVGAGYEHQFTEDFFGAVEVYYADEQAETRTINNVKVTDVSLESSYGLDLKFGHNVTDKLALYGLVGVSQFEFDGLASYTFAPPIDDISSEETAFVYGGGVELNFNDNWSSVTEFRLTNDLELDTPVDRGGVQSDDDLEFTVIRTGLKYRF